MSRLRDVTLLAAILGGSGVVHLVRPVTFEPLMPSYVPAHREVILGSGVLELVAAAGLVSSRYRRPAGWLAAAILVGVYPANLQMALDASRTRNTGLKAAAYARLPLQLPLIRTAVKAARS